MPVLNDLDEVFEMRPFVHESQEQVDHGITRIPIEPSDRLER